MQALFVYVLKVIIVSGVLLLYYKIGLYNKKFHYYNRFYLLFTGMLSLILPVLHLQWFTINTISANTIKIYNVIYETGEEEISVSRSGVFTWQQFILISLSVISSCMLMRFLLHVRKIYRLKKVYPVKKFDDFDFINTDLKSDPFSFFKNIFWRNDIDINRSAGKQILQHEITHIKQNHSLDKIFMQLVLCLYWINPFFWWLRKELYLIHEFIADEKAVKNNNAGDFATMLLTAQFEKFNFFPAQSIFYSPIKRRLIMLTKLKKTQFSYLRRILVLPVLFCIICLFAFTIKNNKKQISPQKIAASVPFKLIVDAGHGGQDNGGVGNGLYEKDLSLKIARRIKALSSEYGIEVVLTRNSDVFMSPKEKSEFANAQNANAFISIHINSATATQNVNSGFEVVVSKDNAQEFSSAVLGSTIIHNLQPDFNITPALQQRKVGIWVLKNSMVPSVLIECGYITNSGDVQILQDDAKIGLMAKEILSGTAMYANNQFNETKKYPLQSRIYTDTSAPVKKANSETSQVDIKTIGEGKPIFIVNGNEMSSNLVQTTIKSSDILSVNIWKGDSAIAKFGEKGKDGVVEITSKNNKKNDGSATFFSPSVIEKDSNFKEAGFPGGTDAWMQYLEKNLRPDILKAKHAPPGIYTVTISFKLDVNGKISEAKALKDPGYGAGKEAVRVINKRPDWLPATIDNKPIVSIQKQNISFKIK